MCEHTQVNKLEIIIVLILKILIVLFSIYNTVYKYALYKNYLTCSQIKMNWGTNMKSRV